MAITFPKLYANSDKDPDIDFLITQTLVPAIGDTAFWTLTNFTIDGDGYIDASAVAVASQASRYSPGVLPGHLYKVTVVVAAK